MKLLLVAALVAAVVAEDSYVVVAPSKVRPGMEFSVSVNILRATGNVNVEASIVRTSNKQVLAHSTATLQKGAPKTIDLQIPADLPMGGYELHVSGTGGLSFANKTHVAFSAKAMSVLVQTDKAMYKPGQTVNFRVLAVYPDLSLYKGNLDIEIFDANSNKIKQWMGVAAGEGVVTQALPLSTQPVLGDWKIKVTAGKSVEEKAFTIAEYVLPKFEVTVELPSYVLESAASVPVTVKAKYTYGKPVAGSVVVQSEMTATYYHSGQRSVRRTGQLDDQGSAVIDFPVSELHHLSTSLSGRILKFSANVTETLTGIILNGSSTVKVYTHNVKLEFPASNPKTFKPGLDYVAYLKVTQPDGVPLASAAGHTVTVSATVTAEIAPTGTTPFAYYLPHTTTFRLPNLALNLPDSGLVPIQLSIPGNATRVSLHAEVQKVSGYTTIQKSYSPSNNYMQLFLRSSGQLRAGGQVSFEMKATEAVSTLVYQVMSRGSIVSAGTVAAGGASGTTFSLPLQADMAPNARIVVYYVRADGEIVTDSISFDVDGAFQNQVSVSMNTTEAEPADRVQVTVKAAPQSTAYLLAVDQSVLLLKSGNDITSAQVIEELKSYDTTTSSHSVGGIMPLGGGIIARRKRMIWWPYPVYYGGSDATQIFQNAGVVVMTDALVYRHVEPFHFIPRFGAMNSLAAGGMAMGGGAGMAMGGGGGGGSADLLGVDTQFSNPAPAGGAAATSSSSAANFLVDIFADATPAAATTNGLDANGLTPGSEENFRKFICKHNGVLYENDLIQIGIKSEYRQNLARIGVFYGNKTTFRFTDFTAEISCPGQLSTQLSVQPKPVEPTVDAGAQVQQFFNMECVADFSDSPVLNISFTYSGTVQRLSLKAPVMVTKFMESAEMNGEAFFQRWKALSQPEQECQRIFKAQFPQDTEQSKQKLLGFGVSILEGIDPNPDNFVSAGILHTRNQQIGCLVRLEPNTQAQMYRLTVRASKGSVSQTVCSLLESQF